MKHFLFITISLLFSAHCFSQDTEPQLTEIVKQVANSWNEVEENNKTMITIKSITATFTLSKTLTKGGELKIWVFKIGRKVDKSRLNKVTLELKKAEKEKMGLFTKTSNELTKFMNSALTDFQKLNSLELFPELKERNLTIEIGLTIKKTTTGGGGYEIGIFNLSGEGGKSVEQGHSLSLVFEKKY